MSKWTDSRWNELATYNSERARGIVHTPEWQEKMRHQQVLFDASRAVSCVTCGRPITEHIAKFGHAEWCEFPAKPTSGAA